MARVLTKKSTVAAKVPLATDLEIGELAVNTADAKLYTKHSDNTVKQLGIATNDSRLTDAREWTASTVTQAEAEAGTATTRRAWTSQRVRQAIAAWWAASTDKTKLDGIQAGAQVNVATNLAQGTRTTTDVPITSSTGTSATLGAATTSLAGVMTSADKTKLAGIAAGATANTDTDTLAEGATNLWFTVARVRAAVLTGLSLATDAVIAATDSVLVAMGKLQAQITTMRTKLDGIAPNATANQADAHLLARANHTGTQASTTISDFAEAVQDVMGATLVQGANVTITYDDVANTLTIAAAGGSGGAVQPWSAVASVAATATLALADAGKYMRCTSAAAVTLTVPPQSSVAWAADTEIHIEQGAAGAVTIAAGAGVTINKPTGYNAKTMSQYAVVTLKRVAADTWTLIGALEVAA